MRKKIAVIVTLTLVFVALLFFRPWEDKAPKEPRFFDRLPDADIIGKSDILDLSRTLSSSLYHYKVPFREFLSPEFILGQGKGFGIDVQKPAFFFANESDWQIESFGAMFMITDSSSVRAGIDHLDQLIGLKDTVVYNHTVHKYSKYDMYFAYGKDWLLIYQGDEFKRTYRDVLFAKINEIPPNWRTFLNEADSDKSMIAKITTKNLVNKGVESIYLSMTNDSTSVTINTEVNQVDTMSFQIRQSGWEYSSQEFTRNMASIHCNIERLRKNPEDPIVLFMKDIGSKISFPVSDLLNAWEGDIAFRQGGIQKIREKYIESELDENFNVTEVIKYRTVKVPSYSVYLSMNERSESFIDRILDKGILTKEEAKYRMLFSPPLIMNQTDSSLVFHTGKFMPVLYKSDQNKILFTNDKTPYYIYLDSTSTKTLYGRIQIPLDKIVEDNISL